MTTQTNPPAANDPLAWLDDAVERATRWRNLYFSKSGQVGYGYETHKTEEDARLAAEEGVVDIENLRCGIDTIWEFFGGVTFRCSEFSHHIQIPVGAE